MKFIQRILFEIFRFPIAMFWRLRGWRINRETIEDDVAVLTGAPHTSNWDYMNFLLAAITLRRKIFVTIKSELFFFPLGPILKALGGIPIYRDRSHNLVDDLAERLRNADRMLLLFTPDGTRSYRPYWKTGFYWAAKEAGVPIILGVANYKDKTVDLQYQFMPSGDIEADFVGIRQRQKNGYGLYHEKSNPVVTRAMYEQQLAEKETAISALEQDNDNTEQQELTA
ncbi:MAG: 1-acyl-sn-glycerol-3-phosphate acyltransferase [Chloroflexota bacterium]